MTDLFDNAALFAVSLQFPASLADLMQQSDKRVQCASQEHISHTARANH